MDSDLVPAAYEQTLQKIKEKVRAARSRAALAANEELIRLYWTIGREIVKQEEARGSGSRGYGANIIGRLSDDLRAEFPEITGFSPSNLRNMKAFASAWPDLEKHPQAVSICRLPWGHNLALLRIADETTRLWYVEAALAHGWGRNVLTAQLDSELHLRQGTAASNFESTLPPPQSELAQQMVKDPYNFPFVLLGPEAKERHLEAALIDRIRDFLMEMGRGFAFVGSQYHLEVGGQDFYLDLLFYHLQLRCYVVVDLKIEDFKPEFAGKMNFYLAAVDDLLRHPDDPPCIGIILCRGRNKTIAEYALRGFEGAMAVSSYDLGRAADVGGDHRLPTVPELEAGLQAALPETDVEEILDESGTEQQ